MAFSWVAGKDGTQYYVNTTNGVVSGTYKDAGNGGQIYKVGFGGDFVKLYHTEALARKAIEKMPPAAVLKAQKLGETVLRMASPKSSTKPAQKPKTKTKTTKKTATKTTR